jgi:glycerophosphoryl diester phosphodiesterase
VLPLAHLYGRRPLVLAHRGASAYAPENTLSAFRLALEMGADGFELDVTLSADGQPVVLHDDTLDRTTDGRGPAGRLTLTELRGLDAGYRGKFEDRFAGERLPTLDEALEAAGGRAIVNIELKRDRSRGPGLAQAVVDRLRAHGLERRVIVSSFQFSHLRRVKALAPEVPVGVLYNTAVFGPWLHRWLSRSFRAEAHHPWQVGLTAQTVAWYHAQGYRVNTWTVNDPADMRRLIAAGVDGLITDRPDVAAQMRE